ncbi:uncharacterized protein EV154DRAFT_438186 [Mucor mucedo]|uniref:uncharacterized protein n=1 Tax=Mucor mucedo TaxID=29922 RepID=UPI0022212739|nr:uncharacterized protein EV154DRAFT_438186 [Mucor mucedo]KAI7894365.1 hypothetical protein EV154DRAFT_438186 [Mucor mucedo]
MTYPPYDAYLSSLDSLVFDSPSEAIQSEKDVADELDLWSNAQFTFDVKPGVGIYDEEKKKSPSINACEFESASGLDPETYDTLVNYLDYELPRQQQVKLDQKPAPKRIQPRPLAPALPLAAPVIAAPPRQILMPKPPVNASILASLLSAPIAAAAPSPAPVVAATVPTPKKSSAGLKRALTVEEQAEDDEEEQNQTPDEDKRRRNTAASARFRVKKKMREQAMEQSVREMTVKSDSLQDRVNNLETEIKFLRSLLLDKVAEQKA